MDAETAMRIISHRAPEAADAVVSVDVFAGVIEVLEALAARMEELSAQAQALEDAHEARLRAAG